MNYEFMLKLLKINWKITPSECRPKFIAILLHAHYHSYYQYFTIYISHTFEVQIITEIYL